MLILVKHIWELGNIAKQTRQQNGRHISCGQFHCNLTENKSRPLRDFYLIFATQLNNKKYGTTTKPYDRKLDATRY